MKLDRNINDNKRGKYALLKLRRLDEFIQPDDPWQNVAKPIADAIATLEKAGILDWGNTPETEFFVTRLKDKYAAKALLAYGEAALEDDREYGNEMLDMALRAGSNHPNCKKPD